MKIERVPPPPTAFRYQIELDGEELRGLQEILDWALSRRRHEAGRLGSFPYPHRTSHRDAFIEKLLTLLNTKF